jgi:hypothetical protein
LSANRVVVALPPSFTPGPASTMLFAEFDSEDFTSNAVVVFLP